MLIKNMFQEGAVSMDTRFIGKPIIDMIDSGKIPQMTILLIIDGCRADSLYGCLEDNRLPELTKLLDRMGYVRFRNCVTAFPSVTVTCHASIMTGSYPGVHGIVGNNWFIRKKWQTIADRKYNLGEATREYVKRAWWHHYSDPGLGNGYISGQAYSIANADLHMKRTIYEAHNEIRPDKNFNIFEMVWRGVAAENPYQYTDLINLDDLFYIFSTWHRKNAWLDTSCMAELVERIGKKSRPALIVGWLPGMDGYSHKNGPSKQCDYFRSDQRDSFDKLIKKLHTRLEREGLLDSTLLVITADHGQYASLEANKVSEIDIYRTISRKLKNELLPLNSKGTKVNNKTEKASIVVMPNGGMCQIYASKDSDGKDWDSPLQVDRINRIVSVLAADKDLGIDLIFVRAEDKQYRFWRNNNIYDLSDITERTTKYPLLRERINGLNEPSRSGDILISSRNGFYYDEKKYKGEHGTIARDDSYVPLIFAGKGISSPETCLETEVRTIDIAPTIAGIMGFLEHLQTTIKPEVKLDWIKRNLEKAVREVDEMEKYRTGRLPRSLNDYRLEVKDMKENVIRTENELDK